jgi:membrane fusion protein, multidrug efflux system
VIRRRTLLIGIAVLALGAAGLAYRAQTSPDVSSAQTSQRGAGRGGAAPVTTAVAQAEDFAIRRRTIGIIESLAIVVVKSRLESQIVQQHIRDGQLVRKGDLLFTLDDRDIKAAIDRDKAQIEKDEASAERTRLDLERYQRLSATNAIPRQQLDQAIADHKVALATVEADKAQLRNNELRLDYSTVDAPISGRTGAIRVTPGNLVSVNDPLGLVTITQFRPIRVAFTLAERDLDLVRKAYVTKPPAVVRVYAPGEREALATGELEFLDSVVDTASGTIAVKAKFANDDFRLWPGMYVDVEIDLAIRPRTVMIPAVAIQSGQNGPFVFVVKEGQTAEMRKVELAGMEGDRAALASGVEDGEKIIVEGQMRLVDGARVSEGIASKPGAAASDAPKPAGTAR